MGDSSDPPELAELKRRTRRADAVLLVTPDYDCALPTMVRDAIAWASRPVGNSGWNCKPALILGVSLGAFGALRNDDGVWQVAVHLRLFSHNRPEMTIGGGIARFDSRGNPVDAAAEAAISQLLHKLERWLRRARPGDGQDQMAA
jgi:chromate reductase